MAETVTMTMEQFQALIAQMNQSAVEGFKEAAKIIVRGDPEEAEKKEALKIRKKESREQLLMRIAEADAAAMARVKSCTHTRPEDGKYTTGGQPNNDGKVRILCQRCLAVWTITPSPENLRALLAGDLSLQGIKPPENIEPQVVVA